MRGVISLWRLSVGKKIVMALTGAVLVLFVLGHMFGNLKVFLGPEHFNAYAEGLRSLGIPLFGHEWLLWIARVVLLTCLVLHVTAATQLYALSQQARDVGYEKREHLSFSRASGTMRWGGIALGLFVIYHLLHLTWGTVHNDFRTFTAADGSVYADAYHNVVAGFQVWPVSLIYILAMVPLCLHLYHGVWSAFQTLGINSPKLNAWRRPLALGLSLLVFVGNVSIPLAVMAGVVR